MAADAVEILSTILAAPADAFGSSGNKFVLTFIARAAKLSDYGRLECSPSVPELAELSGFEARTIRRKVRDLTRLGFIEVLIDPGKTNLYRLEEQRILQAATEKRVPEPEPWDAGLYLVSSDQESERACGR